MWLIDKLFNRKIEGESSLDHLESLTPLEENVEALKKLAENGGLQFGSYIYSETPEYEGLVFVGSDIPEDYTGIVYSFYDDGLWVSNYIDGTENQYILISSSSIEVHGLSSQAGLGDSGVDKVVSGLATAGKVLTADGSGGSSWESPSGTKLYKHSIVDLFEANEITDLVDIVLISTSPTPITPSSTFQQIKELLDNAIRIFPTDNVYMWQSSSLCLVYDGSLDCWEDVSFEVRPTTTDTVTPL